MTPPGRVRDTYAAALQHDRVDLTGEERLIGVVRRPLPWLLAQVDENRSALGPPPALLEAVKERTDALEATLPSPAAHNRAMNEVAYDRRYREYLASSNEAQAAMDDLRELLRAGRDVVLVCYENTDEKRCHRTILKELLEGR